MSSPKGQDDPWRSRSDSEEVFFKEEDDEAQEKDREEGDRTE